MLLKGKIEFDHLMGNVWLELNKAASKFFEAGKLPDLPAGWQYERSMKGKSNFKVVVFKNGNQYAVIFLGTDFKNFKDIAADIKMILGAETRQSKDAVKYVKAMIYEKGIDPQNITVIGNSEGGNEVIHVLAQTEVSKGVTFNAYMRIKQEYSKEVFTKLINYRTEDDLVSKCGWTVGHDFIVPMKENVNANPLNKAIQAHRIDNIGTINNKTAIPAKEYAKTHPKFKNKFGEGTLKSFEIGDIPKQLYPLIDDDVNDKLKKNLVENAENDDGKEYIWTINSLMPCKECVDKAGSTYDEYFDPQMFMHPNCRCTLNEL